MKHALFAVAALCAAPAAAHPDHDEPRPAVQTPEQAARHHVIRLVSQSKLPATWSKAQAQPVKTRTVAGVAQNVVTYTNPAEPAARRTLHVVMGADGSLISATPSAK